ncbi:unnamed protein product [Sphagnum jensenii]|uniref:Fucosyltransferase n=1 Tax=Sphagnum jensenii TaxID=128206 RepID=A0ABP1BQT2_9BRYO
MCEPFVGVGSNSSTSWSWVGGHSIQQLGRQDVTGVGSEIAGRGIEPVYVLKVEHSHPEKKRFFGNTEQSYLTQVPWLYFHGCLYFLPKLFATPTFWTPLEALFPDPLLTLTCLLCTVKLLSDPVWKEIKWQDTVLFKDANQTVSIQVLVTLLHTALYEDLPQHYLKHDTVTGDVVQESQISHQGEQSFNASRDAQALVEILQLSFVDDLIATPFSTFGRLAQAYGVLQPWFFET